MQFLNSLTYITKLFSESWKYGEIKKLVPADVLLFCGDGDRSYNYSGKKYAHLLDSVNELLMDTGLKTITIADPYSNVYGKKAFGNVFCINGLMARSSIKYLIMKKISTVLVSNELFINVWDKVVKKVQPKMIIGIQPCWSLCIAANQNKILIADLQHGALSNEGYYGLKYRNDFNQKGWPDWILCWDETSADWLKKNLQNRVETRVVGNPWFSRFIKSEKSDKLVKEASDIVINTKLDRPVILITLQWGMSHYAENHEIGTSLALVNFIREKGECYTWWIRIHPAQMQGEVEREILKNLNALFYAHDNVSWQFATENPLPLVLRYVDLHITLQSASTIEASWFGISTALLHSRADLSYKYFKELVDNGTANIIVANQTEIGNWIDLKLKKGKTNHIISDKSQSLIELVKEVARM
jgi:hypothetical protein